MWKMGIVIAIAATSQIYNFNNKVF